MLKHFLKFIFFIVLIASISVSCSTDNDDEVTPTSTVKQSLKTGLSNLTNPNPSNPDNSGEEDATDDCLNELDCFDFVFPITLNDGNGNMTTVANEQELFAFFEQLPDTANPEFQFPLTIELENGTQETISSQQELEQAYENCLNDFECFTIHFPIQVLDSSNNEIAVNSLSELITYFESLSEDDDPRFVFPITVTLNETNEDLVLNNDEDLDELFNECFGIEDHEDFENFECFSFSYPINAASNGNEITINNNQELVNYFENLPEDTIPQFSFPITIIYENNDEEVISSLEELEEAFEDCYYDDCEDCEEEDFNENCFEITYPINLIKEDNSTVTVNNDDALFDFIDGLSENEYFDIGYPLNVVLENGNSATLNNDDELITLLDQCSNASN